MKKIILAFDSFKGSLSSVEVGNAVKEELQNSLPDCEIHVIPVADGGEGTLDTMLYALKGKLHSALVTGPLFEKIEASYALSEDRNSAFIEMAQASGLPLIPYDKRNPWKSTSYGTGELIRTAIQKGCRKIYVGIGGSATNDGGIGMLQALGYQFLDAQNNELKGIGGNLSKVKYIKKDNALPELDQCEFHILCDVDNPFYGDRGAAYIFGPQKGADTAMVKALDDGLRSYAKVLQEHGYPDLQAIPGAGAAGGLGGAFTLLNAKLSAGSTLIAQLLNLSERFQKADCVFTGEGRMDYQSVFGKTPVMVSQEAKKVGVPLVIALCGSLGKDFHKTHDYGIDACFSILNEVMPLEEALASTVTKKALKDVSREIISLILNSQKFSTT